MAGVAVDVVVAVGTAAAAVLPKENALVGVGLAATAPKEKEGVAVAPLVDVAAVVEVVAKLKLSMGVEVAAGAVVD